ncbi:MAG TPA: ABC-type transport auxiliary lipoprotein family protein [Steroidobacteraceae bacterium]|nr:ABC-type transport auxiliary lipoprotein family protein [Steroidobacteraceae bacterium]
MIRSPAARLTPLALCFGIAACTGLFHSNAKPEQIYYLRAPAAPDAASHAAAMPASLRVGRAEAGPGLDTTHIMLLQADHRMNFYTGTRWPAPAPRLLEALAAQTLRASGQWASVQDSASPFPSDYLLQMHLTRFEADYTEGAAAPVVHVVLDCTVGRRQGREVLSTFTVSGSSASTANRQGEVVGAFEQATGSALDALVRQAAQAIRLDLQQSAAGAAPGAS